MKLKLNKNYILIGLGTFVILVFLSFAFWNNFNRDKPKYDMNNDKKAVQQAPDMIVDEQLLGIQENFDLPQQMSQDRREFYNQDSRNLMEKQYLKNGSNIMERMMNQNPSTNDVGVGQGLGGDIGGRGLFSSGSGTEQAYEYL